MEIPGLLSRLASHPLTLDGNISLKDSWRGLQSVELSWTLGAIFFLIFNFISSFTKSWGDHDFAESFNEERFKNPLEILFFLDLWRFLSVLLQFFFFFFFFLFQNPQGFGGGCGNEGKNGN